MERMHIKFILCHVARHTSLTTREFSKHEKVEHGEGRIYTIQISEHVDSVEQLAASCLSQKST